MLRVCERRDSGEWQSLIRQSGKYIKAESTPRAGAFKLIRLSAEVRLSSPLAVVPTGGTDDLHNLED